MVFKNRGDKTTATLNINGKQETYRAIISGCEDPVCQCRIADIRLTPLESDENAAPVVVPFDIRKEKLSYAKREAVPEEEKRLAEVLMASMTDEDKALVRREYVAYKRHITDNADLDSLKVAFPADEIENESLMILYNEILPFGSEFTISVKGNDVMVLDHYCLKTNCGCTETVLTPLILYEDRTKELPAYRVGYKSKRWEKMGGPIFGGKSVKSGVLEEKLLEKYPSFYSDLRQRHITLKKLYAKWKKSHRTFNQPLAVKSTPKVGRNDPCPCGSGKKYKKCCLKK